MEKDDELGYSAPYVSGRPPPGPEGPKFPIYGISSSDLESDTTEDDLTLSEDTTDVFAITVTDLGSESDFGFAIENYRRSKTGENTSNNQGEDITSGLSDRSDSDSALSTHTSDQVSSQPDSCVNRGSRQSETKTSGDRGADRSQENSAPWYFKKEYDRYWRHYQAVFNWCQQHRRVTQTLQTKYGGFSQSRVQTMPPRPPMPPVYPWTTTPASVYGGPYHQPQLGSPGERQHRRQQRRRKNRSRSRHSSSTSSTGTATGSEMSTEESSSMIEEGSAESESEEYEMLISEDLMAFYAETEKFRQERDAAKKKNAENPGQEEKFVDMEAVEDTLQPTVEAPKERPGALRTSQMHVLYGQGSAMIHGMETALQMNFDRNLDVHQPPHWPNIPYRLIFN